MAKKFCLECGEPLVEGKQFCGECGASAAVRHAETTASADGDKARVKQPLLRRKLPSWVIGVALLAGAGVVNLVAASLPQDFDSSGIFLLLLVGLPLTARVATLLVPVPRHYGLLGSVAVVVVGLLMPTIGMPSSGVLTGASLATSSTEALTALELDPFIVSSVPSVGYWVMGTAVAAAVLGYLALMTPSRSKPLSLAAGFACILGYFGLMWMLGAYSGPEMSGGLGYNIFSLKLGYWLMLVGFLAGYGFLTGECHSRGSV